MTDFQVRFIDTNQNDGTSSIVLSTGDVVIRTIPQPVADHFRDFVANAKFLRLRSLSKIFFGEEPVLNVEFDDNDKGVAYYFKKSRWTEQKVLVEFSVSSLLMYLDGIIDALRLEIDLVGLNSENLIEMVERDTQVGVYDVFLRK